MDEGEHFACTRRVGFGDCDPAGIAFTGRLVDFAIDAIEQFWEHILDGRGWLRLQRELGVAMPFVRMESHFESPVHPSQKMQHIVIPVSVGDSSVALRVTGWQAERRCYAVQTVSVCVAAKTLVKCSIPELMRAALAARYPQVPG